MEMTSHQIISSLNNVQDNIKKTMEELATLKQEMISEAEKEERSKVLKFIDDSKKAGFTDISKMDSYIQLRFKISSEKASGYLFDYIDLVNLPEATPVKKKGPKPYSEMTEEELIKAKAAKAAKMNQPTQPLSEIPPVENTIQVTPPIKRVIGTKKISEASKIWHSFVKMIQAEMEANGDKPKYEDILKKAKETKESNKEGYKLFSSTWTPEDQVSSSSNP